MNGQMLNEGTQDNEWQDDKWCHIRQWSDKMSWGTRVSIQAPNNC